MCVDVCVCVWMCVGTHTNALRARAHTHTHTHTHTRAHTHTPHTFTYKRSHTQTGTAGLTHNGDTFWVVLAWRVDDLKGIYQAINGKTNPATNGTCIQCQQPCIRTTPHQYCYVGAIAHLDDNDPLRQEYMEEFEAEPTLAKLARPGSRPPPLMTQASAHASATRAASSSYAFFG